jgi:hypothetical protein
MPNQDGSLTGADIVTLTQSLNRMIPTDDDTLAAGSLGLLDAVQERAISDAPSQSAFMRVVEALSLDMLSHAVGGFAALSEEEQVASLRNVENTLPHEFTAVLNLVRDVYYEDDRTPDRPSSFENDSEIFGKITLEDELEPDTRSRKKTRTTTSLKSSR